MLSLNLIIVVIKTDHLILNDNILVVLEYLSFPFLCIVHNTRCHHLYHSVVYLLTYSLFSLCRFLRHVPVVYVDYPGSMSLTQIYGTFNRAMLRVVPNLRAYSDPLTNAMVEFYTMSQVRGGGERERTFRFCDVLKNLSFAFFLRLSFSHSFVSLPLSLSLPLFPPPSLSLSLSLLH